MTTCNQLSEIQGWDIKLKIHHGELEKNKPTKSPDCPLVWDSESLKILMFFTCLVPQVFRAAASSLLFFWVPELCCPPVSIRTLYQLKWFLQNSKTLQPSPGHIYCLILCQLLLNFIFVCVYVHILVQ